MDNQKATVSEDTEPHSTESQAVPEYYTNATKLTLGAYDVVIDYSLIGPLQDQDNRVFRQRMSLQHAWVVCKLLDRLLTRYIEDVGPIVLPRALVEELGLVDEYAKQVSKEE